MDILADILRITRLTGDLFLHVVCEPPWALAVERAPAVRFHMVAVGGARLITGRRTRELAPHDLVLLPHGAGHVVCDELASPRLELEALRGRKRKPHPPSEPVRLRTGARRPGAITELLCGSYTVMFADRHPVLRLLPEVIHVKARDAKANVGLQSTLAKLTRELGERDVGSERVVTSLLEVLFIEILRHWINTEPESATGWLGALRDDAIGRALVELHTQPAKAWTVGSLARAVGSSRAVLARRFTAKVGEPPLAYLRKLRLGLAMHELAVTSRSLADIAHSLGYTSEFAFNRAFRELHGVPPGKFRRQLAAPESRTGFVEASSSRTGVRDDPRRSPP